jgi:hypothetical protein
MGQRDATPAPISVIVISMGDADTQRPTIAMEPSPHLGYRHFNQRCPASNFNRRCPKLQFQPAELELQFQPMAARAPVTTGDVRALISIGVAPKSDFNLKSFVGPLHMWRQLQ